MSFMTQPLPKSGHYRLRLNIGEGHVYAKMAEKYVKSIIERMLPAIAELPNEEWELIEFTSRLIPEEFSLYDEEGHYIAQEEAEDLKNSLEMDLYEVTQEVLNAAYAGLHHLFERTLQRILKREDRMLRYQILTDGERKSLDLKKMWAVLERQGYIPESETRRNLRKLQLIANALKHGEGVSLNNLASEFPEVFFRGDATLPVPDLLELSSELLRELGSAVSNFWYKFPSDGISF